MKRHIFLNTGLALAFLSGCSSQHYEELMPKSKYQIEINPVVLETVGMPFIDSLLASPRNPGSRGLVTAIDTLSDILKNLGVGYAPPKGSIIYVSVDSANLEEFRREFNQSKEHPAELVTMRGILAHELGHLYIFPNTEERADSFALANLPEMKALYRNLIRSKR